MAAASHSPPVETPEPIASKRRRGRAATLNMPGRFEPVVCEDVDDGWGALDELPPFETQVSLEKPRSLITRNDSPDLAFEQSINPYRGCEHGCVYCFARPSHAFLGLSPGLDFESRLVAKQGAAEVLRRELSSPHYQPKVIAIGTNTDPYQPIERHRQIMRDCLKILSEAHHPAAIVTKSALVLRDLDLLVPMAEKGLVKVALSITTLDRKLARAMEPRASTPQRRLEAIEKLSQAGVPAAVMVAPVIPGVTDHEIETILTRAHEAGAREAGYIFLRLPLETQDIFANWLLEHFPDKYRKVLGLVRSARDGKLYDPRFGKRMTGSGPYAWMLGRRFEQASERLGFVKPTRLRVDLFRRPEGFERQLSLF